MRIALIWLAGLFLIAGLALIWGVRTLIAACPAQIGDAPAGLDAQNVTFTSLTHRPVSGWFVKGELKRGAVLLLHGVHSNRRSLIERMRLLKDEGYSVLAIDLQAHGESPGDSITFGYLESQDAIAATAWLRRELPGERIGVIGTSLGGAAAIYAGEALQADALVLEAVYSDIRTAAKNRMRRYAGPLAAVISEPIIVLAGLWLGLSASGLRPVTAIRHNHTPKYLIYGGADDRAVPAEGRALFEAAEPPKEIWFIDGARHVDFYSFAPEAYRDHVLPFLKNWLQTQ